MKSMISGDKPGNGIKITREMKKLEKHYFEKYMLQNQQIKYLTKEFIRIKELAKKFLTPEQMMQIDVMEQESELCNQIEDQFDNSPSIIDKKSRV